MQKHYTMRVSKNKLRNVYVLDVVHKRVVEFLLINMMSFWFDAFECEGVQQIDVKSEHVMLINFFPMVWCVSLVSKFEGLLLDTFFYFGGKLAMDALHN